MADTPKKPTKKKTSKKKAAKKKTAAKSGRGRSATASTKKTDKKRTGATGGSAKKKSTKKKTTKKTSRKKSTRTSSTASKKSSRGKKPSKKMGAKVSRRRQRWPWALLLGGGLVVFLALAGIDLAVTEKFEGRRWQLPAKVYGRPLELYVGKEISANELGNALARLNYRSVGKPDDSGEYFIRGNTIRFIKRGFRFADTYEESFPVVIEIAQNRIQTIINEKTLENLGLVRLDPVLIGGFYPSHNEDRELVKLDEVPPLLIDALLLTEDKDFYQHSGVSFRGIARALWVNLTSGELKQGGSTITQQLVKNFYLNNERTLTRKLLEAVMALLLEFHYSKEEILEAYLNEIYLGQDGRYGIHGFGLASHHYFDKPLVELKTEEIALLAALVKGASYYHPRKQPTRARARREVVLTALHLAGKISNTEFSNAKKQPLGVTQNSVNSRYRYPAYMDLVKRQLRRDYADEDLVSEGLRIFTNLDPAIQGEAERILSRQIQSLEAEGKAEQNTLQGAVVTITPHNGEVVAVVGDKNPRFAGFNRALDAKRQIGSTVKPAVYLAAIETVAFNFNTLIPDEPISIDMPDGDLWEPGNFDGELHGDIVLQQALTRSYNLATANLGLMLGLETVVDVLHRLGLDEKPRPLPSLLLGALELSPMEVAKLYQTFAANGFSAPLKAIQAVITPQGEVLTRYPLKVERKFSVEDVFALGAALQDVVRQGTGQGAKRWLSPELQAAGKTGTTDDQRDSWFAGYTGDYLTVSWLGRDDNKPTRLTGSSGALRVWAQLMSRISSVPLDPVQPSSMTRVWVEGTSGFLSHEDCENSFYVALPTNKVPVEKSSCRQEGGVIRWFKRLLD